MKINKDHQIAHKILDIVTIGLSFFTLFLLIKSIRSFGGSVIFVLLTGFGTYLSIVRKDFKIEINFLSQISLIIALINYIAYRGTAIGFSENIVISNSVLTVILSILTNIMIIRPFGPRETAGVSSSFRIDVRQRVTGTVANDIVVITIGFASISVALFLALFKHDPSTRMLSIFSSVVIFWLINALLVSFYRGSKVPEGYISYLVVKKNQINADVLRKWFKYAVWGTLLIGTVLETIRGLWIIWFLSWIAFLMIILVCWRTWRYVFSHEEITTENLNPEALPTLFDPKFFLKYTGLFLLQEFFMFLSSFFFGIFTGGVKGYNRKAGVKNEIPGRLAHEGTHLSETPLGKPRGILQRLC